MRDLAALTDDILGRPHADLDCWSLVQYLYEHGRDIHLDALPELNRWRVQEIWFRTDPAPLIDVVAPWDILVFNVAGPLADHVGVVLDTRSFIHSRESIGVCKEPLQRWQTRCLQGIRVHAQTSLPSATS